MPIYKDDRNVITPLFDQIRRITETEDAMTFERATESLLNVTPGAELPSAEESAFGADTSENENETGIVTIGTTKTYSDKAPYGWEFTSAEALAIVGFRNMNNFPVKLWDTSGKLIATATPSGSAVNGWYSCYLDNPVNVAVGETYVVSTFDSYYPPIVCDKFAGTVFHEKLTNTKGRYIGGTSDIFPQYTTTSYMGACDIIIAPVQAALPDSYEIQRTTMDDIAEEVQRITGTESKMTVDDIQSGLESVVLQEKSVTPSTEPQTIVPDAGYYGISKVTVGAVEESGGGSTFVSSASGILPTVYKGTANSEFTLNFQSSAVCALSE